MPEAVSAGLDPARGRLLPAFVTLSIAAAFGLFAFTIAAGFTGPGRVAGLVAAVVTLVVTAGVNSALQARPLAPLAPTAASRALVVVAMLATVVAFIQLGRLTVFMVDASRPEYSSFPASTWEIQHSCLSAYFVAAEAADRVPNVYADSLYTLAGDTGVGMRKARMLGPFKIDVYEYPPPFLLVPRALRLAIPGFLRFRMMWFGLNSAVLLLTMLVLARGLPPPAATRALLLMPLVWASFPTLSMLQKGNVQGLIVALSLLAMALFEKRKWMAGGALLAYATVSKLFPGLLLVLLLVRRQWRAVGWTAAMSAVLAGLTIADTGWPAVTAFLAHLPGLVGGEAFPAFRNPMAMAINYSVPGLVFKLGLFGVPGMGFPAAKVVGWLYTIVLLALIVNVSRRPVEPARRPLVWLGVLVLATLRSPFLPQAYAGFPPLLLLVLVGALAAPTVRTLSAVLLTLVALNLFWPLDLPMDPRLLATLTLVPQAATIALAIVALRDAGRDGDRAPVTG